ncbi:hypothetical protein O6H91_14G064200 [Diphasiastrum complanatum]|uniref:Uncharacterized protein n=1 Tax=Diphasiastrum complanatum TaxID=34168 RepID=A0ACC2BQ29_DIPCM|nr:hypothetical protein O6H91_14G064200 [Diphasiastrum complanatum]
MPPYGVHNPLAILEHVSEQTSLEEPNVKLNGESAYTVDDFKPIATLGHGDMGTVFLALLGSKNEFFAMKVMKKDVVTARNNWQRVETEREILALLDHPFLPSLFANFESEKHIYLVTKYCSGGDLNILRQKQPDKKFSEAAIKFYAAEVLSALEYLHMRGIIYRDLKPENILVQDDGHIILTDFDLSLIAANRPVIKRIEKASTKPGYFSSLFAGCSGGRRSSGKHDSRKTVAAKVFPLLEYNSKKKSKNSNADIRSRSFVGTEEYVAPEVVWGTGHGYPVDWWTFGVLLYELFYGRTPFRGSNRKETFFRILSKEPELPGPWSPLKDLIIRLLIKEPENRLGSNRGADEIKQHMFFQGVQWDSLQLVSRPPVVPSPFCVEDLVKEDKELVIDDHIRQKPLLKKNESAQQEKASPSVSKPPSARASSGIEQSTKSPFFRNSMEKINTSEERHDTVREDLIENGGNSEIIRRSGSATFAISTIDMNDSQAKDSSLTRTVSSAGCHLPTSGQADDSCSVSKGYRNSCHSSDGTSEAGHSLLSLECNAADSEHEPSSKTTSFEKLTDEVESMKLDLNSRLFADRVLETTSIAMRDSIAKGKRIVSDAMLAESFVEEVTKSGGAIFEEF